MPIYAAPSDGLAVPVQLLRIWTARTIVALGTPADIADDVLRSL